MQDYINQHDDINKLVLKALFLTRYLLIFSVFAFFVNNETNVVHVLKISIKQCNITNEIPNLEPVARLRIDHNIL